VEVGVRGEGRVCCRGGRTVRGPLTLTEGVTLPLGGTAAYWAVDDLVPPTAAATPTPHQEIAISHC